MTRLLIAVHCDVKSNVINAKQGIVTVAFNIAADGSLSGATVVKSSGSDDLDNAALSAVNAARSIGAKPAGIANSISVPISFTIQ